MADNSQLNVMTGGDIIATDDIGGVKYQVVKISYGPLDSQTPVSLANGLPTNALQIGGNALAVGNGVSGTGVQRVAIASDNSTLAVQSGATVRSSASFTRPANTTAYASGQLVANSVTAGSVVALTFPTAVRIAGGGGLIRRARLRASNVSLTNAAFRLHLFAVAPATITNGDGGAFSTSGAADYLGKIDITLDQAFTDGAIGTGIPNVGSDIAIRLASGTTIYGLLEARAAYTPTSGETFAVDLEIIQD